MVEKLESPKEDPTPREDFTCWVTYLHLGKPEVGELKIENDRKWWENEKNENYQKNENLKKDENMNEKSAGGNEEKDDDDDRQLKNKRVAGSHQAAAEGEEHKNRNLASI